MSARGPISRPGGPGSWPTGLDAEAETLARVHLQIISREESCSRIKAAFAPTVLEPNFPSMVEVGSCSFMIRAEQGCRELGTLQPSL